MRKVLLFLCLVVSGLLIGEGCRREVVFPYYACHNMGFPEVPLRDSVWIHVADTSAQDEGNLPPKPADNNIYLLTAEYSPGYDFITDTLRGVPGICALRVYKNYMLYRTIEVSDEDEICDDVDRCYLVGGDVYTTFSGPARTVVRCNGKEMFPLPRGQTVMGLEVIDNQVYTLSCSPSEWMFTASGKTIRTGQGEILRNLYNDSGVPCFAWKDDNGCHLYYGISGSVSGSFKEEKIVVPDLPVDDVCHVAGVGTIVLSNVSFLAVISIKRDDKDVWEKITIKESAGFQGLGGVSLVPVEGGFYCLGELGDGLGGYANSGVVVYDRGSLDFFIEDEACILPQLHVFDGYPAFVTCYNSEGGVMAFSRHFDYDYPERYISPKGALVFKNSLYVATGMNIPDTPVVVYCEDSREKVLEINGLPLALSKD